mgnify:CR=1 FL=1
MWYLFTLLDSEKGLQFNTLDGVLASEMWFGVENPCHLIHREWEGPLPELGRWVPSTIEITEEIPVTEECEPQTLAEYLFPRWEDEEADVHLEEKYL